MTTPLRSPASAVETTEVAGHAVALHYGSVEAEYGQLRSGAGLVDLDARGRMRIEGARAAEMLDGLVTNAVSELAPGRGIYAAALTPKGKTIADLRIHRLHDDVFLVDAPARAHAGWMAMVRKFVNPRFARYRDVTDETAMLGIAGTRAADVVRRVVDAVSLPDSSGAVSGDAMWRDTPVTVLRVPDLHDHVHQIVVPAGARGSLWSALVTAGAVPVGLAAWEIARVESGRPEWGLDIDETTLPQEANLEALHAISFTKGCYVGQEVVARIHFRGHVNRHLRGLSCGEQLPPMHAALHDAGGKVVGDVRSAVQSPRLGAIALAMVRREIPLGSTLAARWEGGESRVEVVELPFP